MLIEINDFLLKQGINALYYETDPRVKCLVAGLKRGMAEEIKRQAAIESDLGFEREFLLDPDDQDDNVILCLDPEPHFEVANSL